MVTLTPLPGLPLVSAGDDVAGLILAAMSAGDFLASDLAASGPLVIVIAQKIISKAEGRSVVLSSVEPGDNAREIAAATGKDARLVELILAESNEIVRQSANRLITENKLGIVMANAGIDQSNVEAGRALLLPENPDASAARIGRQMSAALGCDVGVIVADSAGRPWRKGVVGLAIGVYGVPAVLDVRGSVDLHGRELLATEIGVADSIAAAAGLLMGQGDQGTPVVLLSGFAWEKTGQTAADILRDKDSDLFR